MAHHREIGTTGRDRTARLIALVATALSIGAYFIVERLNSVLLYSDAVSHLLISRRVVDSPRGFLDFGQLGSVWLPFPHLLMLPGVSNDWLYKSGLAGSMVSMVAFVVTCVLLYKLLYRFTGKKLAGVVAASVYGLSFNMLYLASTAMTESLLFCMMVGAVYYLQRWADTQQSKHLLAAAIWALLATITRYEAWPVTVGLLLATIMIAWQQRQPGHGTKLQWRRVEDRTIAFGVTAFIGILAWVVYNGLIFGDPLEFFRGAYAHPPLTNNEPAVGDLWVTIKTYWFASVACVGLPVLILGAIGSLVFVKEFFRKQTAGRALPILSLFTVAPFIMLSLYDGQRPLHVMQINGEAYNVRYGMIMLVLSAIFIGYLTSVWNRTSIRALIGTCALGATIFVGTSVYQTGVEPMVGIEHASGESTETVTAFAKLYTGGSVLMESWGNENLAFRSVPPRKHINEGSYRIWEPAIANPQGYKIDWIITRCGDVPDKLCNQFESTGPQGYRVAFKSADGVYTIYAR